MSTERRFHSVAETAALIGVSPLTVYRAVRSGEMPAVKLRGRWLVPVAAVDAMVTGALSAASSLNPAGVAS